MEFIRKNFELHVESFMREMRLFSPTNKGIIAVSGGLDSMCLAQILTSQQGRQFEVLHFNHGTRKECLDEEKLVVNFCKKFNLKCTIVHLQMTLTSSNFENKARELRQLVFNEYLAKGYYVYTGHHLDDSFEWSLMQSFKQSSLKSTLGIPVFNQGMARPLLCVSKHQLKNYARKTNLEWIDDVSNSNLKFERNAIRLGLIKKLSERYPNYLRHYVSRQNQLAITLNLHRNNEVSKLAITPQGPYGVILQSTNFSYHKEKIREYIHRFSEKNRGEIEKELDKLIQCHQLNKKFKMHGPFSFSGGVKAYLLKDHLYICHHDQLEYYKKLDDFFSNNLSQIQSEIFPHLYILNKSRHNKSNLIHPLLPLTIKKLKDAKIDYSFLPLCTDLLD